MLSFPTAWWAVNICMKQVHVATYLVQVGEAVVDKYKMGADRLTIEVVEHEDGVRWS